MWDGCIQGTQQLLISPPLLAELEAVLSRPKFGFIPLAERQTFLVSLAAICEWVEPRTRVGVIQTDPSDNRVLECALDGRANAIVTRDQHLLSLSSYQGIPLLTPAAFLRQTATPR